MGFSFLGLSEVLTSVSRQASELSSGYFSLSRLALRLGYPDDMELIFEIRDAEEGGYCARALGHAIFTEAETWEELRANVLEAVGLHFEDEPVRPDWCNCTRSRTN